MACTRHTTSLTIEEQGANGGFDRRAPITYLQMGAGDWRTTDKWPPSGPATGNAGRELFLRGDRSLQTEKAPAVSDPISFTFDPAHPVPTVGGHVLNAELLPGPRDQREKVESRPDVVVFTGPALEKPLEIDGKVQVKLYVSSDRTDTDFTVMLTDGHCARRLRSMVIWQRVSAACACAIRSRRKKCLCPGKPIR